MWGQITPDEVEAQTFSTSFRGYQVEEVDEFLQTVAESMRAAVKAASENAYLSLGDDIGELLQNAKDTSESMVSKAEEQSGALRAEAERDAARVRKEADEDAARTRADSDAEARRVVEEAQSESQRVISKAQAEVERLEALESETRARVAEVRLELASLVDRLDGLVSDARDEPGSAAEEDADHGGEAVEVRLDEAQKQPAG